MTTDMVPADVRTDVAGRFAQNTAAHEMTVLRDDGLYRHLRFFGVTTMPDGKVSRTSAYWFELVAWPGGLVINGDMGSAHFTCTDDMFGFFRGGRGRINPGYWAEKAGSGRDGLCRYDEDRFRQLVMEYVGEAEEDWPGLTAAVERDIFPDGLGSLAEWDTASEDGARAALDEFRFGNTWTATCSCGESLEGADEMTALSWRSGHINDGNARRTHLSENRLVEGFRFRDTWEWDLTTWTYQFLWCCHAIVWGIGQYDKRPVQSAVAASSPEQMLREFHAAAGLPLPAKPTARPDLGSQTGRAAIVAEELRELAAAIEAGDITEIADACADVVYGVVGTAVTYGIPFDAVLKAVHASNMTKVVPGPPVLNDDGKILKGPGYEPPRIAALLGLDGTS
jgi:predicted HAD superfamily Cof-like phosphohydrolase